MQVDGVVFTYTLTDTALFLLEIQTALIDIGDQRYGLGKVDMYGLVVRYILIETIRVFYRAILDTGRTTRAVILDYIARRFSQRYRKIACLTLYASDFGKGKDLNVGMPADLDQFGRKNSHGTVVGGVGFVQLGHMPADRGGFFDQIDLEAGSGQVQGSLNAANAAADDQHVAKFSLSRPL
jgi:hypothetical protein